MTSLINEYQGNFEAQELIRLIAYTKQSVFLTGKAGTGKSTLLRKLTEQAKKKYVILASTGVAALNVGGQTIHSFFRIEPRPYLPNDRGIERLDDDKVELLRNLDLIIIDEVSMVRCDLLQALDLSLRKNLNSHYPFAGKQLLLIGDLFQLPPVVDSKNVGEKEIVEHNYETPYFFSARCFGNEFSIQIIELQKVYRQSDPHFIGVLNAVRSNTVQRQHLVTINNRYLPTYEPPEGSFEIILSTTNAIADNTNERRLNSLDGFAKSYTAIVTGDFVNDTRNKSKLPAEMVLQLKVHAQVMFIKNDKDKRWVNGSLGKITSMANDRLEVKLDGNGQTYTVERAEWERVEYRWNKETEEIEKVVTGTFKQFPLKLAWAVTIHKSQGQTFENVVIDLGTGAFTTGQTYVALSRCKTLEGIKLKKQVKLSDIKYDPRISDYLERKMNLEMEQQRYISILSGLEARLATLEPENNVLKTRVIKAEQQAKEVQARLQQANLEISKKNATIVETQKEGDQLKKQVNDLIGQMEGLKNNGGQLRIWIFFLVAVVAILAWLLLMKI